jgi:beta-fructofuranosidase
VPLSLADGETLHLHIFVDRSVIEVFANGHTALTTRVYPMRPDSLGLGIFARDSTLTVKQVDVWQLGSIW